MSSLALEKSTAPKASSLYAPGPPRPGTPGGRRRRSRVRSCSRAPPPRTARRQAGRGARRGRPRRPRGRSGSGRWRRAAPAVQDQRQALGTVELFLEPFSERRVLAAGKERDPWPRLPPVRAVGASRRHRVRRVRPQVTRAGDGGGVGHKSLVAVTGHPSLVTRRKLLCQRPVTG